MLLAVGLLVVRSSRKPSLCSLRKMSCTISVCLGGRAAEIIESDLEPLVDLLVLRVELIAKLLRVTPASRARVSVAVPYCMGKH